MPRLTPEEAAAKHAARLKAAISDMQRGIQRVTVAPTQLAAAKQDKMKARLNAKIDDGTWARNLKAVDLSSWQNAILTKGLGRVAQGVDASQPKVAAFYQKLFPAIDAARSKIASMPDVTVEDNINRVATYIREMSKFRK
jgi:hypothetical protein